MIYISVLSQNLKLVLTEASDTDKKFLDYRTELSGNVESNMTKIDDAFGNVQEHINDKTNPHNVTAEQIGADPAGSSDEALNNAKQYTDEQISNIPTPDVSGQINEHNISSTSHTDIRSNINQHKEDKNNPHDVTYEQVGADKSGSASTALESAKQYTDQKISAIPPVDISGKIDKIIDATQGNIPIISSDGQLQDSGKNISELSNFVPVTGGEFSGDVSGKNFIVSKDYYYSTSTPFGDGSITIDGIQSSSIENGSANFKIDGTYTLKESSSSDPKVSEYHAKTSLQQTGYGCIMQFGDDVDDKGIIPRIQFTGTTIQTSSGKTSTSSIYCYDMNGNISKVIIERDIQNLGIIPYQTEGGVLVPGYYKFPSSPYGLRIEDIYVYAISTYNQIGILRKVISGYLTDAECSFKLESSLTYTEYPNSTTTLYILLKMNSQYYPLLCYSGTMGLWTNNGGSLAANVVINPLQGPNLYVKQAVSPTYQQTYTNITDIRGTGNFTCRCVSPYYISVNI